ncbi:hypothetical protein RWX45_10905, partial [Actinomyces sp. MRS3W]|nr:hypothetical protein [Actinomyces sp. MRS3W]
MPETNGGSDSDYPYLAARRTAAGGSASAAPPPPADDEAAPASNTVMPGTPADAPPVTSAPTANAWQQASAPAAAPVPPSGANAVPQPGVLPAAPGRANAALRSLLQGPGLVTTGLALAVVLGTALISAVLLLVAVEIGGGGAATSLGMLVVAMGFSLGGGLQARLDTDLLGLGFSLSGKVGLTALPLGVLVAIAVGVFLLARRRAPVDGSAAPLGSTALRAAVEAAVVAVVACLVTGTGSFAPEISGEQVVVRASAGWILVLVWLIVFGALICARAGSALGARLPHPMRQVLRELGALTQVIGVVLGVLSIIADIYLALANDATAVLPLIPVLLGNLIVYAASLGTLGAVSASGSAFGTDVGMADLPEAPDNLFAWTLPGPAWILLLVAMLIIAVAAAARVGTRRTRLAAADMRRVWQLPAAVFVVGIIVLHLVAPVRVSVHVLGTNASASAGPAWWSSLTLTVFAFLVSLLAEVLPAWLYANAGSLLQLCAGAPAVRDWVAGRVQPDRATTQMPPPAPSAPSAVGAMGAPPADGAATPAAYAASAGTPLPPVSAGTPAAPVTPVPSAPASEPPA